MLLSFSSGLSFLFERSGEESIPLKNFPPRTSPNTVAYANPGAANGNNRAKNFKPVRTKLVGVVIPLFVWIEGYKLGKHIIKVPCPVPAFWQVLFYIYIFQVYDIACKFLVISIVHLKLESVLSANFIFVEVHLPVRFVFSTSKCLIILCGWRIVVICLHDPVRTCPIFSDLIIQSSTLWNLEINIIKQAAELNFVSSDTTLYITWIKVTVGCSKYY